MLLFSAPSAVLGLAALTVLPSALAKPYPVHFVPDSQNDTDTSIEKRACANGGTPCGWYGQICCSSGEQCITDQNNEAQCVGGSGNNGQWQTFTSTWVESVGIITHTSVYSTFVPGAVATKACSQAQSPCGSTCCDSGFYCKVDTMQCVLIGGGSTGGIFPTVTYTGTPTATVPFQTPIPTGATGGMVETEQGGGGLSGGAIAGIVIGVLVAIFLLLLLCLFCCARALFDTIVAIFGFGKKRKHTHEETYVESHHHSGGAAGGRWYGQGRPSRPSRVGSEKKSGIGKGLGMAAALGGLALALGLKRKHDKKDDKSTTVSGSSYYYSDYTSSSSASSSDRHTRRTRHSSRR